MAQELKEPTDLQFVPRDPALLVVLEKQGKAWWLDLAKQKRGLLLEVSVRTASEQGLLGLAFHPKFADNGRLFLNTTVRADGEDFTQVAEWSVNPKADLRRATPKLVRVLFEVRQPYVNHNGGQLAFGPDGMLYVGLGDGGAGGDPQGNGQDLRTLLGTMMRIDVDAPPQKAESRGRGDAMKKSYAVPKDNPFVGRDDALPEIWAYGLRNPWRYSFDPKGRLIVADVGQNAWEEISIVERGANLGWNIREGSHCYKTLEGGCRSEGLVPPIHQYPRKLGVSITGGYTSLDKRLPAILGHWIFGDFGSGRIFALDVDAAIAKRPDGVATQLGRWPIAIATFGRDAEGRIYVADFQGGTIYRIDPEAQ